MLVGSWGGEKGVRPLLSLILCEELGGLFLLQEEGDLLGAGGQPQQRLLVLRECLLVVLLVVMVGLVLGFDFFERVQWPFDPFPNFVGGCWPPSVMPWYFLKGPKNVPLIC